eukprot:2827844-Rhodomonas_salina.1
MGSSSDKTTLPLWQRVGGYLSARMNALFQTMGTIRASRNVADIKLVLDTAKLEMQDAREQPVASLRMGQILDAVLNVRYLLMLSCIKSIPHSELRPTVTRMLDTLDVNGTGVNVTNSPSASEFLHVLGNKSARDLLDTGANTFVPALFHTYDDFFAFLSTLPWGMPKEIKKRVIGSDGTINAAHEKWKTDNADPVRMKAGKRGDPPVSRDMFATWYATRSTHTHTPSPHTHPLSTHTRAQTDTTTAPLPCVGWLNATSRTITRSPARHPRPHEECLGET